METVQQYDVYIHIKPNVHCISTRSHKKNNNKEWVSPEILPYHYTLQMFVFIRVVIPLVTLSRKNCPSIKGYITDVQPCSVLGLTSRCSYSTVVGKDLCGLPSALFSLNCCIWLLLFHKKETHVGLMIRLPHQEPIKRTCYLVHMQIQI